LSPALSRPRLRGPTTSAPRTNRTPARGGRGSREREESRKWVSSLVLRDEEEDEEEEEEEEEEKQGGAWRAAPVVTYGLISMCKTGIIVLAVTAIAPIRHRKKEIERGREKERKREREKERKREREKEGRTKCADNVLVAPPLEPIGQRAPRRKGWAAPAGSERDEEDGVSLPELLPPLHGRGRGGVARQVERGGGQHAPWVGCTEGGLANLVMR